VSRELRNYSRWLWLAAKGRRTGDAVALPPTALGGDA
jgi:hypothetical protein